MMLTPIIRLGNVFCSVMALALAVPILDVKAQAPPESAPTEAATEEAAADPETEAESSPMRPFQEVIEGFEQQVGVFTTYQNPDTGEAYLAIQPHQLNRDFFLIATLESGIGEGGLFSGWPINDVLIQFRRAPGDKLQLVVPNLYFRDTPPMRSQPLLQRSFSDSVLYALPIVSSHPDTEALLINLNDLLLMRDPANLMAAFPWVLGSYAPNPETSYLETIRTFPENLELSIQLGFTGGGGSSDPFAALWAWSPASLPDARAFGLTVRYSLSSLPLNPRYQPRPADERVGYFITAYRTPAQAQRSSAFMRYINRWHLEKQNPEAAISPPQEPIVFWIENTVPPEYRTAIREGVLMWNQAFEQAGFQGAIEVRQMPDNADWDPADVRYNVIRWSDSFRTWAIGLGPSRVNPYTGEILDADVILDANVIRLLYQQYQSLVATTASPTSLYLQLCGHRFQPLYLQWLRIQAGADPQQLLRQTPTPLTGQGPLAQDADHCAGFTASQQAAFGALATTLLSDPLADDQALDTYIYQYLRALTAHEVGHVLGLRHNFLGSTLLAPEALNDPAITRQRGLVSSVMDYFPPNLAPPGKEQGDYFPGMVGPYDRWAIEYGYRPFSQALPHQAQQHLQQIAQRSPAPELAYAADEDIWDFLDPKANAWDLSNDPLHYARWQLDNSHQIWQKLNRFSLRPGEGYGELRQRFSLVFFNYLSQAMTISNYIGGQRFTRLDPWQTDGQPPFQLISLAEQREALQTLDTYVFAPDAFQFSPELLNQLAPDRWRHWGSQLTVYPLDYPIYNQILLVQGLVLSDLFYADRLTRLRDADLKAGDQEVLTLAELFETLKQSVWTEVLPGSSRPVAISSLRRGLQRHHLAILSNLVLRGYGGLEQAQSLMEFLAAAGTIGAPEDARVLARHQLRQLQTAVDRRLGQDSLELTTRAHLEDVRDRIAKVLDAPLQGY